MVVIRMALAVILFFSGFATTSPVHENTIIRRIPQRHYFELQPGLDNEKHQPQLQQGEDDVFKILSVVLGPHGMDHADHASKYLEYFGSPKNEPGFKDKLRQAFRFIAGSDENHHLPTVKIPNIDKKSYGISEDCLRKNGGLAYSEYRNGEPITFFCPLGWSRKKTLDDTSMEVTKDRRALDKEENLCFGLLALHELLHPAYDSIVRTRVQSPKETYGLYPILNLARTHPEEAVYNVENAQYFALHIYLQETIQGLAPSFGKDEGVLVDDSSHEQLPPHNRMVLAHPRSIVKRAEVIPNSPFRNSGRHEYPQDFNKALALPYGSPIKFAGDTAPGLPGIEEDKPILVQSRSSLPQYLISSIAPPFKVPRSIIKRAPLRFAADFTDRDRQKQVIQGQKDFVKVLGVVLNSMDNIKHSKKFKEYFGKDIPGPSSKSAKGKHTYSYRHTIREIFRYVVGDTNVGYRNVGTGSPDLAKITIAGEDDPKNPCSEESMARTSRSGSNHDGEGSIFICDNFWGFKRTLQDISKNNYAALQNLDHMRMEQMEFFGVTLMHEVFHMVYPIFKRSDGSKVGDHAYGPYNVQKLAKEDPDLAKRNVESAVMYALHIYFEEATQRSFQAAKSEDDNIHPWVRPQDAATYPKPRHLSVGLDSTASFRNANSSAHDPPLDLSDISPHGEAEDTGKVLVASHVSPRGPAPIRPRSPEASHISPANPVVNSPGPHVARPITFEAIYTDATRKAWILQAQKDAIELASMVLGPNGMTNDKHKMTFGYYFGTPASPNSKEFLKRAFESIVHGAPVEIQVKMKDLVPPENGWLPDADGKTRYCDAVQKGGRGLEAYVRFTESGLWELRFCEEAWNLRRTIGEFTNWYAARYAARPRSAIQMERGMSFLGLVVLHELLHPIYWKMYLESFPGGFAEDDGSDKAYGPRNCQDLARKDPKAALKNVDNAVWYAMYLYLEEKLRRSVVQASQPVW